MAKKKPNGYWQDYNRCYEEAKKYKSIKEFMEHSSGAYAASLDNKWINDYTWLQRKRKPNRYWSMEMCYNEAKKYKSSSEFSRKSAGAYHAAQINGWLDKYDWFSRRNRTDGYCVYVYEDSENKFVYVGLTCDFHRRDMEHRNGTSKHGVIKYDSLNKYFNGNIPKGKIVVEMLTPEDAQYYEGYYAEKYVEDGWTLINKAKTGSLGACVVKWDYETCLEEAKKYKSRTEFSKKAGGAYAAALNNKWIDEYTWFESPNNPHVHRNYETCFEEEKKWMHEACFEVAKKCKSKEKFKKYNSCAYNLSLRYGWIDEFFPKAA